MDINGVRGDLHKRGAGHATGYASPPGQNGLGTKPVAARDALRRADIALARVRGVFISAGYGPAAVNAMLDKIAHLISRIDRALVAKP